MMLRATSGLSRSVLKWMSQVAASLGATLAATFIWSAVPHPSLAPAPQPELTSGGKFAARAIQPVAYDGLDTMPLPSAAPVRFAVAPGEGVPAERVAPVAGLHRAAWDEAPAPVPAAERPARAARPARPPLRTEARRVEIAPHASAAPSAAAADPSDPAAEAKGDESFLHRLSPTALPRILPAIVSTAREAWTLTASAGDTLVAHVVPQMP